MSTPLHFELLGEFRIFRDGVAITLPTSRKTRALLVYLALTGRSHRRERLCEIFWDLPNDPRGSLRWALCKIRQAVNDNENERIVADRERASLDLRSVTVDVLEIRRRFEDKRTELPLPTLHAMAAALAHPVVEGLDLPRNECYQHWLQSVREDAHQLRLKVLQRVATHSETSGKEGLRWVREWYAADPMALEAARALVCALRGAGYSEEAQSAANGFYQARSAAGLPICPDLLDEQPAEPVETSVASILKSQSIRFCQSTDGVRIAYASVGSGPPLVKAANWLNHLELDWGSPIWSKTFQELSDRRTFIRYDERGNGLSDWDVPDISFAAFVHDLETVVDQIGLDRFPLLGMSQGCAVSIEYAVRHPERVSALILIGGYAAGWRIGASPAERERREAVMTLTRLGWGTSNAAYRHIFSQTFMPEGSPEELSWFDEFQRRTTSAENAVRFQDAFGDIDVRHLLSLVRVPTLVLHARMDQRITLKQGRELAIGIPDARMVVLESRSHIILGHEPAWGVCMQAIEAFLSEHGL